MATADVDMLSRIQRMRATGMSEKEILSSAQLTPTKGGDQAAELPPQSLRAGSCPPPAVPTHGTEPWGSWSHSVDEIVLELELPDGVRAKELDVDVVEGWLYVQRTSAAAEADAAPPLLFGRLAQSHLASELMWAVDTLSNGRQMLCITLPKKERGRLGAASADCIFDESLHIRGEPCLQAGLSQGTITLDLPQELQMD